MVPIPRCDLSPCFDFFDFRVALSSFKYPENKVLMERGGGGGGGREISTSSASGLSLELLLQITEM